MPGSVTIDEYRALLNANRIDRSKIKEIDVAWDFKALLDGKVDGLIDYEEIAPAELIAQGRKIAVLRFADFGVRIYSLNLIVNEMAWMEPSRQSIARKIAEAVQEGYQLVRDNPAGAAKIFGKRFPDLAPRYVELSMQIVARQLAVPIGSQTRSAGTASPSSTNCNTNESRYSSGRWRAEAAAAIRTTAWPLAAAFCIAGRHLSVPMTPAR